MVRYDGHAIVEAQIRSARDLRIMLALSPDMWSHRAPAGEPAVFRIPPERMPDLAASGVPFRVLIPDVQVLIDAERSRLQAQRPAPAPGLDPALKLGPNQALPGPLQILPDPLAPGADSDWFLEYKNLAAVNAYIDALAALRPDLARIVTLGPSLQGRPIRGLRIANDAAPAPGGPGACKPAALFNSCQHAREWVSVMVNVYLADQLLRTYDTDPAVRAAVDAAEIYIIPVVNPDGYEFSWTTDRLWRKNRRPNAGGSFGVDTNRNWSIGWGLRLPGTAGGTSTPTSQVYWGTGPFSEPETQRLGDLALSLPNLRTHNDIHSFGQYILTPWGWTDAPPPDAATVSSVAATMRDLIAAVPGSVPYRPGPVWTTLYPAAGIATDWFYGARNVLSYTFELRGNPGGFILPADQILPNAREVFPALLHQVQWAIGRFPFKADLTRDCLHDVRDFAAFQNLFALGDLRADFTGDGALDIRDFAAFQNEFALGR